MFTNITIAQYQDYSRSYYGDNTCAILTMNTFTIKPDMDGNPN